MERRTYYYARVSSKDQHLDRQLAAFAAMGATERDIITDKESGKDMNRSGYIALKTALLRRLQSGAMRLTGAFVKLKDNIQKSRK